MNRSTLLSAAALVALLIPAAVTAHHVEETSMDPTKYVVMKHMNGTLALRTAEISGVWYMAATEGKDAQIRVTSPALSEAKTFGGSEADSLWKSFHDGALAPMFLLVPHMGGTLAIPREQIRTMFYSEDGGKARLRMMYEGDPSGKTLEGDDATRIWKAFAK